MIFCSFFSLSCSATVVVDQSISMLIGEKKCYRCFIENDYHVEVEHVASKAFRVYSQNLINMAKTFQCWNNV